MGYNQRGQRDFSLLYYILYVVIVFGLLPAPLVGMIRSGKIKFNKERKNNEEIDINTALYISVPMFLFSVLFYIQFKKKENHHLINYRPVLLCKLSAICSSIYNVMLPILLAVCYHYSKEYEIINKNRHIISLSFTLVFAPMTAMANISRYVKLFLLNKRDIGRMKLYDDRHNNAYQSNFEPNDYLKRLNKLVSRQITLTIFVAPYSIILIWGAVVLYYQKHVNGSKGDDNSLVTFSPVMFITTVGNLITPYIFFKLYKTLNFVNMMDLISNIVSVLVATALFVSTLFIINGKPGLSAVRSPSLFFIIPSFFTYFNAICIPLIEVYLSERKIKGKKMLNKKEFTKLLLGSRYIDSLKSTAVKCYCVETVLFWDMHMKLMKMIGEAMGKKDNHSDTNSDERVIDIKQTGMACNNISSPLPTSYELLLGLNKNIFGNDNNAIIYAGCNSNSNDLNQLTNSRPTDPRNAYKMMGQHYDDSSRDRHYNMSSGSRGRSYTGDRMGSSHGNNNNSHNNNHSNSNNNNNSNNYNYNSNSNSNGYYANDMRPTVALTNGSVKMYGQRQRNDSISQFSNNSYPSNSNGFLDSANSEKVGLLYHSEPLDLTGSRNLERGFTGYSLSNASSSTLINQSVGTGGRPYGHTRNNSLKNSNTEIFYELFNVDPNHVELPQEFWEDFRNLYFSFISDRSLATVNLDLDTINRLKKSLNNRKYTIDMFFPAISETVDLMYQNLYPKLLAK